MYNKNEDIEEVLKKIEESAQDIPVPESLEPENIKTKLQGQRKHFSKRRVAEIAAAVALVVLVGGTGIYGRMEKPGMEASNSAQADELAEQVVPGTQQEEAAEPKKEQVGDYHLAKDYDEVYDSIVKRNEGETDSITNGIINGGILEDLSENKTSKKEEADYATAEDSAESSGAEYSNTNLQVEGVDESDFVKNDGNYLYIQKDDQVSIIDIRGEKMKKAAEVEPDLGTNGMIMDMYVDGDRLYLIIQMRVTSLSDKNDRSTDEVFYEDVAYTDYYTNYSDSTILQTYDITGRTGAKLLGTVTVDGSYRTSRKVGDYIYLFMDHYVGNVAEQDKETIIPQINGEKMQADCIYVQQDAVNEFIAVSVNTNDPGETVDQMVLMNTYAEVYMGNDSICFYSSNYSNNASYTDITKFTYKNGQMSAVAAASVRGTVEDTFAISESDGILRVLTTEWRADASENQLYLLDENLELKGSLKNIATGEEIYAARYVGDIAYFITYHNTDPLFAVDISDPEHPKMLGQIEVTGFSDYLHPFGENLLLGIGYETDPDTSERLGVKLTMFDISDPTELKVIDSVTFSGDYCHAASDYKSALVDVEKNLIGFEISDWSEMTSMRYMVYSWDKDHFSKLMTQDLNSDECHSEEKVRGLYARSRFYLLSQRNSGYRIQAYDMDNKFETLDELKME